jgi:hypothetical protein
MEEADTAIVVRERTEEVALLVSGRVRLDDPIGPFSVVGHEQKLSIMLNAEKTELLLHWKQ